MRSQKLSAALRSILAKEGIVPRSASAMGVPRPFAKTDWYGWAGAESWPGGEVPWIVEVEFPGKDISDEFSFEYNDETGSNIGFATAIADAEGVGLYFSSDDGDQGPMFHKTQKLEPEEAEGALKAVVRHLKSGRVPSGFRHDN